MYSLAYYASYFLICLVWIYWIIGLFFGKIVVVDFILVIQVILIYSMTTGALNPGFAGMMLDSFVFFCFTGIYQPSYETRSIYEDISLELKSANISYHAMVNLNLMLILLLIVLIVGLIASICLKFFKDKR
jgi:glucose dehydrogenase